MPVCLYRTHQLRTMNRTLTFPIVLFLPFTPLHAQWVGGGVFSTAIHFQACAFQDPDSGLFVYGANNPGPNSVATEGGLILTDNGDLSGGYYLWYEPSTNMEDIDVKVTNGRPLYMAAGHELYDRSVVVRPYLFPDYPMGFDSVRTGIGRYYRAIRMRDDLVAFAAGGNNAGDGIIDMSTDTGATWTNIAVLPGQPVSRLHFVNDQLGFAACGGYKRLVNNGVQLADSGAIYRTINGGADWQLVHTSNLTGFSDVAFLNESIGVASRSDGAMLRTMDGGDTWIPASVSISGSYVLTSVTFRPDGMGFASAYRQDGTEGLILISDDDGETWHEQFSTSGFNHSRRIYDLYFFDDAHGYASTHIRPLRTNGIVMDIPAEEGASFGIQPNPATDMITLTLDESGPFAVEIIDATGRVVRSLKLLGVLRIEVPVNDLPAGTYVVRLRGDGMMSNRTMVRL